ncbi:hypothetical protein [Shewanella marina]|uniref:hypothetical protein n=1 Tax=Shewanella marina TaxID=487319 RepID=UPI00046FAD30|nr:hypothetical protein [Shewanella marina]
MGHPDKALLIELMDFPRQKILQGMELAYCPHAGFFNPVDEQCIYCHQGMECVWMNHNDKLVALEQKDYQALKQQLLIALDYIDSSLTPHHLSRRNCECDNCVWMRKVSKVLALETV